MLGDRISLQATADRPFSKVPLTRLVAKSRSQKRGGGGRRSARGVTELRKVYLDSSNITADFEFKEALTLQICS